MGRLRTLLLALTFAGAANAEPVPTRAELHALLLKADVVVVGRVQLDHCLDACSGEVLVESQVRGAAVARRMPFVTAAPTTPVYGLGPTQLIFLSRDLAHAQVWRVVLTPGLELGLAPELRTAVQAVKVPRARVRAERAPFAADLEALRRYDGQWRPESAPVVAAARRVFSQLDLRGLSEAQVQALLGAPRRAEVVLGRRVLNYAFHDGEQGVMPQLWMDGARVFAVVVVVAGR